MTRFRVARSTLLGVYVSDRGEVDLSDGEIANNAIGINIQAPYYDLSRLQDRVFVDRPHEAPLVFRRGDIMDLLRNSAVR